MIDYSPIKDIYSYNSLTGIFTKKSTNKTVGAENERGYLIVSVKRKRYRLHILAWLLHYGCLPKGRLEHIDGDRKNNAIINLKIEDKKLARKLCKLDGCGKPSHFHKEQLCQVHYFRRMRGGGFNLISGKEEIDENSGFLTRVPTMTRHSNSAGYIRVRNNNHPLADKSGSLFEHRMVYFDVNGAGPFECYLCSRTITWDMLHIDHLDDVVTNNDISNLEASCPRCNMGRGYEKGRRTYRAKYGIEFNGELKTLTEWGEILGLSNQSMRSRINKMPLEEALTKPRGNSGPKPRRLPLRKVD